MTGPDHDGSRSCWLPVPLGAGSIYGPEGYPTVFRRKGLDLLEARRKVADVARDASAAAISTPPRPPPATTKSPAGNWKPPHAFPRLAPATRTLSPDLRASSPTNSRAHPSRVADPCFRPTLKIESWIRLEYV